MSLNIGKLDENSLEEAIGVIDKLVEAAMKIAENDEEIILLQAWDLIYSFGDLGDSQDLFGEFAMAIQQRQRLRRLSPAHDKQLSLETIG